MKSGDEDQPPRKKRRNMRGERIGKKEERGVWVSRGGYGHERKSGWGGWEGRKRDEREKEEKKKKKNKIKYNNNNNNNNNNKSNKNKIK